MTIGDAAEKLGITKEAIYNRIRRGSMKCVTQNGEKYIILDNNENIKKEQTAKIPTNRQNQNNFEDKYINLLIAQIDDLKHVNKELNKDKEILQKEKEELLVEQKNMLERVYKEKDEQLKAILTLANRTLLASPSQIIDKTIEAKIEENLDIKDDIESDSDWHRLKTILKEKGYSKKKKKKILKRLQKLAKSSDNITNNDGDIYIKNFTERL